MTATATDNPVVVLTSTVILSIQDPGCATDPEGAPPRPWPHPGRG